MDDFRIDLINSIISNLNKFLPVIFLVTGTFGHLCNLIIFSKRAQRTNPISFYFLSNTITNLIALYTGLLIRYLQDISHIDLVNNNSAVCKVRSYLLYLSLSLSNWYILLATIDRYLISSNDNNRRRLSTIKNAYCLVACLTIILIVCYCHIFILYNVQISLNAQKHLQSYCYPQHGVYRIFNDIQLLIQFSLLPPLLMTFFVLLIIRNIRASHRRILDRVTARRNAYIRKRDLQLSRMLLLQVIITIMCSLPLATSQLIASMTSTQSKDFMRVTIEQLFSQISRHLAFLSCSISFYLYTLSGSQFRFETQQIINNVSMFFCNKPLLNKQRNFVKPIITIQIAQRPKISRQQIPKINLITSSYTEQRI